MFMEDLAREFDRQVREGGRSIRSSRFIKKHSVFFITALRFVETPIEEDQEELVVAQSAYGLAEAGSAQILRGTRLAGGEEALGPPKTM